MFRALAQRLRGKLPDIYDFGLPAEKAPEIAPHVEGELAKVFFGHRGRVVHKWVHYLPIYDRHFGPYRGTPVKMLEIGVFKGGSLQMWREYFGPEATLVGVDVNPECASYVTPPTQVRIGSQDDPAFLRSVVEEMGAPDIILDDGSHIGRHQEVSFRTLFPLLKEGGLYMIEDMHTAYWPGFYEGGYRKPGTAIELVKQMVDDMHAWYHDRPTETPARDQITGIHIYDSITVLEKGVKERPGHIQVG